jgi:glycosyltransferase involved in cell wall biosynthesis
MVKLSIIIPIYNVELYIAKCLDSVLRQDIDSDEYEIICINDGSPDNSKDVAMRFAAKYSNIIFIDQENQGVSVARNRGLEIAKGDYIAFVDPDDMIYENSLKPVLERAYKDNIDVLYLNLQLYNEAGLMIQQFENCGDDTIVTDGFSHNRRTFPSTLYKRSVIGDIRFVKGIIRGQDTVFNIMVHAMAQRCSYCSVPYYKYLQRETSSRQFVGTPKNFVSCLLAIDTIQDFKLQKFPNQSPLQKQYFDNAILIFIQRTLEWNILPQSNKENFYLLKHHLHKLGLDYLVDMMSERFPMFNRNFNIFMGYGKIKWIYNAVKGKLKK